MKHTITTESPLDSSVENTITIWKRDKLVHITVKNYSGTKYYADGQYYNNYHEAFFSLTKDQLHEFVAALTDYLEYEAWNQKQKNSYLTKGNNYDSKRIQR